MPLPSDMSRPAATPSQRLAPLTRGDRDPRTAPFVLALMAEATSPAAAHLAFACRLRTRRLAA